MATKKFKSGLDSLIQGAKERKKVIEKPENQEVKQILIQIPIDLYRRMGRYKIESGLSYKKITISALEEFLTKAGV